VGYQHYVLPDGREAGYGVAAVCDREGCEAKIDRGLGYLCGNDPDGWRDDSDFGCGKYFCGVHTYDHSCPNPDGEQDDDEADQPEEGE
jgi:hypothetical protein